MYLSHLTVERTVFMNRIKYFMKQISWPTIYKDQGLKTRRCSFFWLMIESCRFWVNPGFLWSNHPVATSSWTSWQEMTRGEAPQDYWHASMHSRSRRGLKGSWHGSAKSVAYWVGYSDFSVAGYGRWRIRQEFVISEFPRNLKDNWKILEVLAYLGRS